MSNNRLVILLFIFVSIAVTSCKKKSGSNPFGNLKISNLDVIHSGATEHYRIVYDTYNNVDSMIIIGGGTDTGHYNYRKFSYFGSSYTITDINNNTFTVQASTSGLILKVLVPDTIAMIYNGTELGELDIITPKSTFPYVTKVPTNYYWTGGDVKTVISQGVTLTYDYDPGKSGQPADALRIDAFLSYGKSYIKTNHVPTDMVNTTAWLEKYFYQYDGGKITQLIKVRNNAGVSADDTVIYNYRYY
jgi:hypothetical protein